MALRVKLLSASVPIGDVQLVWVGSYPIPSQPMPELIQETSFLRLEMHFIYFVINDTVDNLMYTNYCLVLF